MSEAVCQAQQGAWTMWETMQERKVSWNELWRMKSLLILCMVRGAYDLLPTTANLARNNSAVSPICPECVSYGSLQHVLCACPQMLGKYKWRHDQVLGVLAEVVKKVVDEVNKLPIKKSPPQPISIVAAGTVISQLKLRQPSQYAGLLQSAGNGIFQMDLDTVLHFPVEMAVTSLRPDIVV